ncbi:hypothetical protein TNCV_1932721 [Trichonephila clavipes]|nr:hypothetical protein TNCV_1932721 [Trichonephila clavipes]
MINSSFKITMLEKHDDNDREKSLRILGGFFQLFRCNVHVHLEITTKMKQQPTVTSCDGIINLRKPDCFCKKKSSGRLRVSEEAMEWMSQGFVRSSGKCSGIAADAARDAVIWNAPENGMGNFTKTNCFSSHAICD